MSHGATSVVWHHSQAKGTDLLVLMAIANWMGDDGCWPKIETIAKDARTSTRQVHRSLAILRELGEIEWEHAGGMGRGVYKTNRYFLLLKCPENCNGDWNHTMRQNVTSTENVRSRDDNLSGLEVTPTADKPVNEPVIKPVIKQTKKIQTHLPVGWKPSEALQAGFADKWPSLKMAIELEAFTNYHLAKGSKMADWDAAFRTWCGNAVKWAKPVVEERKIKGYR